MTLRSLEIFLTVAIFGKMSDAANHLHISQPTVSQAIAEIEKEYNLILFNRLSKKLYITDAGRLLFEYAQTIISTVYDMEKNLSNLSEHKTILMGATMTIGSCIMLDLVNAFEKKYLDIQIYVTINNTAEIEKMLLGSSIDIAFVEGTVRSSELISIPILEDELVLVCTNKHSLAQRNSISLSELNGLSFILREEGSGTREIFINLLRENNIDIITKWTCQNSDANLNAVIATNAMTVISKRLVQGFSSNDCLTIIPIDGITMNRTFNLVYHKSKYFTDWLKKLSEFIQELKETVKNH